VQRLAALSLIDYDRERDAAAKALRIRTATLDAMVRGARGERAAEEGGGQSIKPYNPEPWPDPVELADVLDEMHATVRRYIICPDFAAHIAVLWAAHTHVYERCTYTPRLIVTAPAEECAKSRLLKVIKDMTPRPMWTENPSIATFYRLADEHRLTFYLSEVDEYPPPVLVIVRDVNGGCEPDGGALRCVGDAHEVRFFSTFVPVAFDGINLVHSQKLPRTSVGRSHVIEMQRATPEEVARIHELDRAQHLDMARNIARKLARWARDHGDTFAQHRPDFPPAIVNRRRDKWRAMLAIAEIASPAWADRARAAMLAESGSSPGKLATELNLLLDASAVIRPDEPVIWTEHLIERLCALENSRWADHNARTTRDPSKLRIRADQVSDLLAVYGIKPMQKKRGGENRRGYRAAAILSAAARYAPAGTADTAASPAPTTHREIV
jgi:putative DNA primase/helicase